MHSYVLAHALDIVARGWLFCPHKLQFSEKLGGSQRNLTKKHEISRRGTLKLWRSSRQSHWESCGEKYQWRHLLWSNGRSFQWIWSWRRAFPGASFPRTGVQTSWSNGDYSLYNRDNIGNKLCTGSFAWGDQAGRLRLLHHNRRRGQLHNISVDFRVFEENQQTIVRGVSFIHTDCPSGYQHSYITLDEIRKQWI